MKNLIIGGCYGYKTAQVWPWAKSMQMANINADKVLIVLDDENTHIENLKIQNDLKPLEIDVVFYPRNPQIAPHVDRFFYISEFLRTEGHKYDYVLTTDVRDVVFQSDPFVWMNNYYSGLPKYRAKFCVSSECLTYENEPWGNHNLMETFGSYVHSLYKNNIIYNVGVLFGITNRVKQICLDIAINSLNKPIQICDQAVFNFMMYNSFYSIQTYFLNMNSGWCAHLGTVMDPSKIDYFKPNLIEIPPYFDENAILRTHNHEEFCIIHQYDRTPWKDNVIRKYL